MAGNGGYIKLWRRTLAHPVFKAGRRVDTTMLACWTDILSSVAWRTHSAELMGTRLNVKPGQMLFTYRGLGRRWDMDKNTAKVVLAKLEAEGMVRLAFCTHHQVHHQPHHQLHHGVMLLTVVNWRRWQGDGNDPSPPTSPRTGTPTSPLSEEVVTEEGVRTISQPLADPETRRDQAQPLAAVDGEDDAMRELPEVVTEERDLISAAARCVMAVQKAAPTGWRIKIQPPSPANFAKVKAAIVANGGRWAEVMAGLVSITQEAKAEFKTVAYPVTVWEGREAQREIDRALAEEAAGPVDPRVVAVLENLSNKLGGVSARQQPEPPAPKLTDAERGALREFQAKVRAEREADEKAELTDAERKRISEMARETIERLTH